MFDVELTRYLAELSKLSFTEAELQSVTAEMQDIVALMDTIADFASAEPSNKEAIPYTELREDKSAPSLPRSEILAGAGERSETCFKVPKVV